MTVTLTFAAGVCAAYFIWQILNVLQDPLRSIPGPLLARFTRLWHWYRTWLGHWNIDVIELHRKYDSKIIRYAPGRYSISDSEAIKTIHGYGGDFEKADSYKTWNPPGTSTLFTEPNRKVHGQLRKKYQTMYSMSSISSYESYVGECVDLLCLRLEEREGQEIDLENWISCFTTDCVGMLTYGKRFGFLNTGKDVEGMSKAVQGVAKYATLMGIFHELHRPYFWLAGLIAKVTNWKGTPKMYLNRFTAETVAHRRQERATILDKAVDNDGPVSMLDKFLSANEKDPEHFTTANIMIGLGGNIVAGSDTTSAAITTAIYYLITSPTTALSRLIQEIPNPQSLSIQDLQTQPILNAIISETLRLFPQTGMGLPRTVPPSGAEICGYRFPSGSIVTMSSWATHYDTEYFGSDAAEFNIDRWLNDTVNRAAYFPFGLGSRNCIGKNIADLIMLRAIPALATRFEFELVGELESIDYFVVRPTRLPVIVRKRAK